MGRYLKLVFVTLAISAIFAVFPPLAVPQRPELTANIINDHYAAGRVKLLIVPGHDNDASSGGTSFRSLTEAALNLDLSEEILKLFNADKYFQTLITRDAAGYKEPFASYFNDNRDEIIAFRDTARASTRDLISLGFVSFVNSPAQEAQPEASIRLNGINKWINENNIDVALHVHFNDYAGRRWGSHGRYSGFVVFIPEKQMPNFSTTYDLGNSIFAELNKFFPKSNNPKESLGLVQDQELIALGGGRTLNANTASALVEYGYIYESAWLNEATRKMILKEIAYQTYMGIKKYFDPKAASPFNALERPYFWNRQIQISPTPANDILALQVALTKDKLYPPTGFYRNDCPMSGIFGRCTRKAVLGFQGKYGLSKTGYVDLATLKKINQVYKYSVPELF